nr:vitellogenin 3 [Palaemon carinicauda]
MASLLTLVTIGLLATASAAPWSADVPRCADECPILGSQKLYYAPGNTYSYSYTGRSEIHMKDVEGGVSQMEWTSQVDLTWINPCDMAISFKNPSFGGASGTPEASFLTRYPMMVAMKDGRVSHVCSHPDDDTWSINLKKGVASAFQNSLPSNSSVNSGLNFTETDITGQGPTLYKVRNEGEKVIVEKRKNHRYLQERFPSQSETPMSWIKAPLPIQESMCKCRQEITRGIYTSIVCEDRNIIKPVLGSYKYIEAKQESKLQFQSESSSPPAALSTLKGHLVRRSLLFNHETLKKNPKLVPQLEQALKHVCEKTKNAVEKDAALWVDKAIHLMRHIPEEAVEEMLQKVKSGEICSEKEMMESLFLDIVAYVQEASTVKLMIREMMSGRATGGRVALYTAALFLTPRPSIHAVEAVKPLLEECERFPMACLAASSMVNTYCKHHPHCQQDAPVRQAAETLSRKIQERCSSGGSGETEKACLASLKSLGNMGAMTSEVARNVISIIEKRDLPNVMRVTAAQAFRNAKCEVEPTKQLVRIALDPKKKTEIRIASYLAAIRCMVDQDLQMTVDKISKEENTQVRGFILSHLWNLQESSAPHKERLRYMLSGISIPSNFTLDVRQYSRNIDLSYYAPSFGIGGGVESNIIYGTRSFIPRSVKVNVTSALGATPVNLGEFGMRFEGLEPIMEKLFGPEGYFQKSSLRKILRDATEYAEDRGSNILEHLTKTLRERRSIDLSTISHFFSQVYGEQSMKESRADFFARISGQEIAYASLTKKLFEGVTVDGWIDKVFNMIDEALRKMTDMNANTARVLQVDFDQYLPTIQGLPLRMKINGTAVVGLKIESRLNSLKSSSASILKMKPSLSGKVNGFIGFDSFMASCGVRSVNDIASKNGFFINVKGGERFEIELDVPEKMDVIDIRSENYLMKAVKGQGETRISPPGVRISEVQHQDCLQSMEKNLVLKMCYDVKFPNMLRSQGLPLGQLLVAKLTLEKVEPSMKGWKILGFVQNTAEMKEVKIQMKTEGSSSPRMAEAHITSSMDQGLMNLGVMISSHASGGYKVELKGKCEESEKLLEANVWSSKSKSFTPETQVVEVMFASKYNGEESQMELVAKTKHDLRPYIAYEFEAVGDVAYTRLTGIPYLRRLHKFDLRTQMKDFKWVSTIEKKSGSEYATTVKVESRSAEKFAIEATHNIEGGSGGGIVMKTVARVKSESGQYKAVCDVHNTYEKIGTSLQIVSSSGGAKIVDVEAMFARAGQIRNVKFQMDMPRYMKPIKFEVKTEDQGNHQYQFQSALRQGSVVILQTDGVTTFKYTPSMLQLQIAQHLQTSEIGPHSISTTVIWAKNKQELGFEIKDLQKQLVSIRWDLSAESSEETKAHFKLMMHDVIDNKIDAIISKNNVQVSFSNVVKSTGSSHHVRGFSDVDLRSQMVKIGLGWDVDRDPNQKLSIEAKVIGSPSSPHQTVIHGVATFVGKTYNCKVELRRADSQPGLLGKKDIAIEITTPSQKTYALNTNLDVEKQPSRATVRAQIRYKNPERKEFRISTDLSAEHLGRPYNFKMNAKANVICPEGRQTDVSFESKHEFTGNQREVLLKMNVVNPALSKPLETSFILSNQPRSYEAKWMIDVMSPADGAQYDLKVSPEGVQSFKVGFDLKEIVALLKAIHRLVGAGSGPSEPMGSAKYLLAYERPERWNHKVLVHSPSRHMEGEARCSSSEYRVTFHPERHMSDKKYEMAFTSSERSGPWESELRYEGRVHHPSLERERRVEFALMLNEKTQGTLELDIFPRSEDKITGTLESTMIAMNSYKVEAKLTGKVLKVQPKVIVSASYARHNIGFDLVFEKSSSAKPSFVVSGKYDRSFGRNAAVAFTVRTEEGPVVEMSAAVKPKGEPSCNGLRISAKTYVSTLGKYDLSSELCKPGFARVSMWKEGSSKHVIARLGLRAIKDLEFSISEKDERRQEESYVAMMKMKLISPKLVNTELKWRSEKVSELQEAASEKMSRVSSGLRSWVNHQEQEILNLSGSSSPSSEMSRLWQEAKQELHRIYSDLSYDGLIPSKETIERWWNSPSIRKMLGGYKTLWSQVDHLKKKIYETVPITIRGLKHHCSGFTKVANGVVVGGARWIETGEMPEEVKSLCESITNTALWQDIKALLNDMASMFGEQKEAIIDIMNKYRDTLWKDWQNILKDLGRNMRVQETVNWILNEFNMEKMAIQAVERVVNKVIQSSLLSSVQIRGSHVEIQIPLRRPVNSLTTAWNNMLINPIPVPENVFRIYETLSLRSTDYLLWSYYSLFPRHVSDLIPPFNRTAVIVDGTEILTFDRAVLRAPRSACKVLLAVTKSFSLTMENPPSSPSPKVTFKVHDTIVVIQPDHKVTVNGREVSGEEETAGPVMIKKTQEKIKVMSPYMILRIYPRNGVITAQVSGWKFGRVAGLLGTYDGEMANDWLTVHGTRAANLQELVKSWQEDQSCQTPHVAPLSEVAVPPLRYIQCKALLGIRSRCNPLVRPDPFIKMCLTAKNACDVAKAYNAVCSARGVKDIFPLAC